MRFLAIPLLAAWCIVSAAEECGETGARHWTTVANLNAGLVTLHWTQVYEGLDTVCGLTYKQSPNLLKTLDIWGQPEVNAVESLLAFRSCADDGCRNKILVVDIVRGVTLRDELPLATPQSYLKLKWSTIDRQLIIEAESYYRDGKRIDSLFRCSVTQTLDRNQSGI